MLNFSEFVTATAGAHVIQPIRTEQILSTMAEMHLLLLLTKIAYMYLVNWFLRRISGLNKIGFPCRRGWPGRAMVSVSRRSTDLDSILE